MKFLNVPGKILPSVAKTKTSMQRPQVLPHYLGWWGILMPKWRKEFPKRYILSSYSSWITAELIRDLAIRNWRGEKKIRKKKRKKATLISQKIEEQRKVYFSWNTFQICLDTVCCYKFTNVKWDKTRDRSTFIPNWTSMGLWQEKDYASTVLLVNFSRTSL